MTDTPTSHEGSPAYPDGEAAPPRTKVGAGTYAAALAFAFLILRVFAVSGYNWDTAFLVSTTLGLDDGLALLFGSLMAGHLLVGILLVVMLPLMVATYLWAPAGHRSAMALPALIGLIMMAALTISFMWWWLPLGSAALLALFGLVRRRPESTVLRRASSAVMSRVGMLAGIAVLMVAALIQTPWVPLERIETADGTLMAYVLSVDSGYLNVLTQDHEFKILISADVLSRD